MGRGLELAATGLLALLLAALPMFAADAANVQPRIGETPPDSLGKDRRGDPITVSQHRGKVLIVTFWASWCTPCRKELPILARLKSIVGEDALEVVAVNFKQSRPDFAAVVRANRKLPLNFVPDTRGVVSDSYGVESLPNMFVIGADGRIAHVHRGYSPEMLPGFFDEIIAMLPPEVRHRPSQAR